MTAALDARLLGSLLGLALAVALAAWPGVHARLRLVALAWYGLTIFPGSNLLVPIGTLFGERLLYLPSVGFVLVVAALAVRWLHGPRRSAAFAIAGVALCLLAIRGAWYARAWANDYSIFTEGVRVQPASAQMQLTYGGQLLERRELSGAAAAFARAAEILDGHPLEQAPALVQLGVAYEQQGRPDEAERLYARVLEVDPVNADALWRRGVVRWGRDDRAGAVRLWEQAIAANPRHAPALADLGLAAYVAGDLSVAEARLREAARHGPSLTGVWFKLGLVLDQRGKRGEANAAWRRYLELAPGPSPEREEIERRLGVDGELP